jgi:metallo-beta-lactamase family protein
VVPSFAIGRAQELLYTLRGLEEAGRIPVQPVYVDSPMAANATDLYCRHGDEHNLAVNLLMDEAHCPLRCRDTRFIRAAEQSKALNDARGPFIVISASGMCEGGRVMHHLKHRLPDSRNTVLLAGFQAQGTRGRMLREGAQSLTIHGEQVPVRARIAPVDGFSAHGDRRDLLRWLRGFTRPPRMTFVVHGEPPASEALRALVHEQLGWPVQVPSRGDLATLE